MHRDDHDLYDDEAWDDDFDEDQPYDDDEPELLVCPECGADVYEDAEQCPSCGMYISPVAAGGGRTVWVTVAAALMVLAILTMVLVPILKTL